MSHEFKLHIGLEQQYKKLNDTLVNLLEQKNENGDLPIVYEYDDRYFQLRVDSYQEDGGVPCYYVVIERLVIPPRGAQFGRKRIFTLLPSLNDISDTEYEYNGRFLVPERVSLVREEVLGEQGLEYFLRAFGKDGSRIDDSRAQDVLTKHQKIMQKYFGEEGEHNANPGSKVQQLLGKISVPGIENNYR